MITCLQFCLPQFNRGKELIPLHFLTKFSDNEKALSETAMTHGPMQNKVSTVVSTITHQIWSNISKNENKVVNGVGTSCTSDRDINVPLLDLNLMTEG